ncbi:MAG: hypothetical protein WBW33_22450 [Bryobacteraceae bacterium]
MKSNEQPESSSDKGPNQPDGHRDVDNAQSGVPPEPEESTVREVLQTTTVDTKPSEHRDSPNQTPVPQAVAPAAIQFSLASIETGVAPEPTQEAPEQAEPVKAGSKAASSSPGKTVRKKTTTRKKLNQEPPPEELSGLSNG